MKHYFKMAVASVSLLALSQMAWSQVEPAPDFKMTGPKADRFMGPVPANLPPPPDDPRDLNGNYVMDMGGGDFGGGRDGAPGGQPARPPGPPPERDIASDVGAQTLCMPELQIGGASPYGGQIIQTSGRVTIITEYNHVVRRIYLDRTFPAHIEPSYGGFSIGHWEGDTLVVETRGLKGTDFVRDPSVRSVSRVVERIRKLEDRRHLEDIATVEGKDAAGQPITRTVSARILWRPDVHLLEFICEGGAGAFFNP